MRIAILNLTAGGMSGGYRKYLKNILPRFSANTNVESIICASPKNLKVNDWFEPLGNVKFVDCKPFRLSFQEDFELKKSLENFSPDVIFIPMERYFKFKNVPVVNMLTNMLPMVSIENNVKMEIFRNIVQKMVAKRAISLSDRVIAVSRYVHEYLCMECDIPLESIGIVYHGVDLSETTKSKRPKTIPEGWEKKFIFTAGSIDPYRGLEDIIVATRLLMSKGIDIKVVIGGSARQIMMGYFRKLRNMAENFDILSSICWTGYLGDEEMSWCYRNCSTFLMTSRVEACPNIALEAMSYGCISICANNPPLPEIFGDSAIYYSTNERNSLSDVIFEVINLNVEQRNVLSKKSIKRASCFSWDNTVNNTLIELSKVKNY